MSLRAAVRGIVLAAAGAAAAVTLAALLSPSVRRAALGLVGRGAEPEPQQPTHIVLPDRLRERDWSDLDEAIEAEHSAASGDVALTGA
jgi:hypothetical protein